MQTSIRFVKFRDDVLEELLGLMTLQLHRVGQDAYGLERLGVQVDLLCLLEPIQAPFFASLLHQLRNQVLRLLILAYFFNRALDPFARQHILVRNYDSDSVVLQGISVQEHIRHNRILLIDVFDFLRCYILSLA